MPDKEAAQREGMKPDRQSAARKWLVSIIALGISLSPVPIATGLILDCWQRNRLEYCLRDLEEDFWTPLFIVTIHAVPFIVYALIIRSRVLDEDLDFSETIYRVKGGLSGLVLVFFTLIVVFVIVLLSNPYNNGGVFFVLFYWPFVSVFAAGFGCQIGAKIAKARSEH